MIMDIRPSDYNPRCVTVACVLLCQGEVLLLLRAPDAPSYPNVWAFPAGKVDPVIDQGDIWGAMLRELAEETGIALSRRALTLHGGQRGDTAPLMSRLPDGRDYDLHLFSASLFRKPVVTLSMAHQSHLWMPTNETGGLIECITDMQPYIDHVLGQL